MHIDLSRELEFRDEFGRSRARGICGKAYWIPAGWRVKRAPQFESFVKRQKWREWYRKLEIYPCETYPMRISDITRYKVGITYRRICVSPLRYEQQSTGSPVETAFLSM